MSKPRLRYENSNRPNVAEFTFFYRGFDTIFSIITSLDGINHVDITNEIIKLCNNTIKHTDNYFNRGYN